METEVRLTTDRLVVRTITTDDLAAVVRFLSENRSQLSAVLDTDNELFYTEPFWIEQLARDREALAADRALRLFMFSSEQPDRIIGTILFDRFEREPLHTCRLSCAVDGASEGRGLMSEALFAAIAYMFAKQNVHRVEAVYPLDSKRCEQLFERLGFEEEGKAVKYRRTGGRWHDYCMVALVNRHWEPPA